MNSPYMGRFQITQAFTSEHDGLDLVGLDDKNIHSTVNGTVIHAGWENPSNHSQGFGLYVCIRVGNQDYYYGHMSQIYVSVGQTVKITDIIGLEGSTGYSTGSHCHYCCRVAGTMTPLDINAISGIPNVVGGVYDDGASGGTIPGGGGISGGTPNGGILSDAFQLSYLNGGSWTIFTNQAMSNMDGIKIQATRVRPYYLTYRTRNQGQGDFYPYVTSSQDDYAGSNGKPMQLLQIQAFDNNGTKLTTGVVVMYRVHVGGRWLPWVSNADPEWMQSVFDKHHLDGSLDTTSADAGLPGQNIDGVDIRVYECNSQTGGSLGGLIDGEVAPGIGYMIDGGWEDMGTGVLADHIDGLKIQTDSTHGFYLTYQTWNQGQGSFYPEVTSLQNDYAGSAGKPIQLLSIRAYKSDGTKLTSGVVIMYRALVNGRWLPWVSNADPQWMDSVKSQYNLDGTLDYTSYYAGIDGQNISGLEIRAFVGTTNDTPIEGLTGQEAPPALSYMVDNNWTNFDKSVIPGRLDGLKIQTDASKPYYITYRTHNQGQGTYYPFVTSRENDYAGSAGKPIQLLSLYAYRNDGTKLVTGVVVMYRAYVEGRWLPWVSNANPEWMRSVQAKYNLDGLLDEKAYYAGIDGKNISGIEVRIFEENNTDIPDTPQIPSGQSKIIDAPFISQMPNYPTGCESVATVMALQYAGKNISVDTFIDQYLPIEPLNPLLPVSFDPYITFGGNPRTMDGYGCYAPVIKTALDKIFANTYYTAENITGLSLPELCSKYIDNNIPVIVWATMEMKTPYISKTWTAWTGRKIQWVAPEHCLLLVGYDDYFYYFNDPRDSKARTYYRKEAVDRAYKAQGSQAVVIQADARTAREWKVRQVLSAFEMVKDKLPSGSIEFEKTIRLLTSDTVDVELIVSETLNFMPINTNAIYNVTKGRLDVDLNMGSFPVLGAEMTPSIFLENGKELRDIALKMSSGNLAVSVKNVVATDSYSEIAISYIINMNDISLANGSNVEMSMELTQIVKQKRPPSDQEGQEMEIFENITALYRSFSSGQIIDREAIGSFFSETSVATTMTIGGIILIAIMAVLAFA